MFSYLNNIIIFAIGNDASRIVGVSKNFFSLNFPSFCFSTECFLHRVQDFLLLYFYHQFFRLNKMKVLYTFVKQNEYYTKSISFQKRWIWFSQLY